jgi:hypothetical protein
VANEPGRAIFHALQRTRDDVDQIPAKMPASANLTRIKDFNNAIVFG